MSISLYMYNTKKHYNDMVKNTHRVTLTLYSPSLTLVVGVAITLTYPLLIRRCSYVYIVVYV